LGIQTIRNQAAKWFTRMQYAEVDHPDRSQFEAWLLQHPLHAEEYSAIAEIWDEFDSTDRLQSLTQAMHLKAAQDKASKNKILQNASGVVFSVVLSVLGYFGWSEWQAQPLMQMAQSSQIAQIITQSLPDGSKMILNSSTEVEVVYYRNRRSVHLKRGEAIFEVTKDTDRPFIVHNDQARVTVLGTRFSVNQLQQRMIVAVDHGRVKVEAFNQEGLGIILTNGQMAEISGNANPKRLAQPASNAFSFVEGKLVFDNTSLREVAETLSRYRDRPVLAEGEVSTQMPITAVVNIREIESFLKALKHMTGIRIDQNQYRTKLYTSSQDASLPEPSPKTTSHPKKSASS